MQKTLTTFLIIFAISSGSLFGQSNWSTVYSTRGNFNFAFPSGSLRLDTLSMLSYFTNLEDSTIALQVNFMDSVYISGNEDLQSFMASRTAAQSIPPGGCYVDSIATIFDMYAQMYQSTTQGTIEGYIDSDYISCLIRGKELTIRHPTLSGDGTYTFAFTRYFYWNQKFLAFTVTGPESKLTAINAYKNQLFSSVNINF